MARSLGSERPTIAADRVGLPHRMLAALVATTAGSVGLATQLLPTQGRDPTVSLVGGAFAGALAVVALRFGSYYLPSASSGKPYFHSDIGGKT